MTTAGKTWKLDYDRKGQTTGIAAPIYYVRDTGCNYSEGKPCLECPWDASQVVDEKFCLMDLTIKEWQIFNQDWKADKALRWRDRGNGHTEYNLKRYYEIYEALVR